jgi:diphthine-ammonia ligase
LLFEGCCTWQSYTDEFCRTLARAAAFGVTYVIFGDIMFEAHKAWTERVCASQKLTSIQPIWGESTADLAREFVNIGGHARMVTVCLPLLDETWLGCELTLDVELQDPSPSNRAGCRPGG